MNPVRPSRLLRPWSLVRHAIGPLALLVLLAFVDLPAVGRALAGVPAGNLALGAGLGIALILIRCLRWHLLLRSLGLRVPLAESISVYADGLFWGHVTPARLGELKRLAYLTRSKGVGLMRASAIWTLDQGFDALTVVVMASVLALSHPAWLGEQLPPWPAWGALALLAGAFGLRRPILRGLRRWGSAYPRLRGWIEELTGDLDALSHGELLVLLAASLASFATYVGMVWVMASYLPIRPELPLLALATALVILAGLLPVSIYNLGSREAALWIVLGAQGFSLEQTIALDVFYLVAHVMLAAASLLLARLLRRPAAAHPAGPWAAQPGGER